MTFRTDTGKFCAVCGKLAGNGASRGFRSLCGSCSEAPCTRRKPGRERVLVGVRARGAVSPPGQTSPRRVLLCPALCPGPRVHTSVCHGASAAGHASGPRGRPAEAPCARPRAWHAAGLRGCPQLTVTSAHATAGAALRPQQSGSRVQISAGVSLSQREGRGRWASPSAGRPRGPVQRGPRGDRDARLP